MAQLEYNLNTEKAVAGLQADLNPAQLNTHRATETIDFGRMVAEVAGTQDGKLPSNIADVMLGVAVRDLTKISGDYQDKDSMNVIKQGKVYVLTEQDVTPSDPVFVRYAAGTESTLGAFRKDDDTTTAVAVPNAKFFESALAGELVAIDLNLI